LAGIGQGVAVRFYGLSALGEGGYA
jgi:hypothetical protein